MSTIYKTTRMPYMLTKIRVIARARFTASRVTLPLKSTSCGTFHPNWPLPSCLSSLFQNAFLCMTLLVKVIPKEKFVPGVAKRCDTKNFSSNVTRDHSLRTGSQWGGKNIWGAKRADEHEKKNSASLPHRLSARSARPRPHSANST